jgi:hypothetical protein
MSLVRRLSRSTPCRIALALALVTGGATSWAQERVVYRCPGNLYTDQITAKEAQERGCKTLDGAAVTVILATPKRDRAGAAPTSGAGSGAVSGAQRGEATRVDPAEQRARDSDARRILDAELRKEEDRLATLQRDYAGGTPERLGSESNYARYQERVADMKAAIDRKLADIAAIKREIAKLGTP